LRDPLPVCWACVGPGAASTATTVARNVMAREAAGRRSRRGVPHRRGAPRRAVSPGSWVARITTDTRPPSDDPEDQPRGGDRRAGDAVPLEPQDRAARAGGQGEADPGGVQRGRGRDEAHAVGPAGDRRRHLGPVRVAVEEREDRDRGHREGERQTRRRRGQRAEREDRQENPRLDAGQPEPRDARDRADRHRRHERDRQRDDGPATELRRPHADRDHGEEVVRAQHGVRQSVDQSVGRPDAGMRPGDGRSEERERTQGSRAPHDELMHSDPSPHLAWFRPGYPPGHSSSNATGFYREPVAVATLAGIVHVTNGGAAPGGIAVLDGARAVLVERFRAIAGGEPRDMPPIPEHAPAISRLLVDDLGYLWALVHGGPDEMEWDVFDD